MGSDERIEKVRARRRAGRGGGGSDRAERPGWKPTVQVGGMRRERAVADGGRRSERAGSTSGLAGGEGESERSGRDLRGCESVLRSSRG